MSNIATTELQRLNLMRAKLDARIRAAKVMAAIELLTSVKSTTTDSAYAKLAQGLHSSLLDRMRRVAAANLAVDQALADIEVHWDIEAAAADSGLDCF